MVPAFSVSASAINIDGYDVFTIVYDQDYGGPKEFESTVSLGYRVNPLRITFDIHFPEVIKKNTVFDLQVGLNIGEFLTISELNGGGRMYDSNWKQLDGSLPGIVQNGILKESQIIAPGDVKYIRYEFEIYSPTWHIVNTPVSDNITDLSGTTWQLNNTVNKVSSSKHFNLQATISSDGYSITMPYNVSGYDYYNLSLPSTNKAFQFATYGGSSTNGYFIGYLLPSNAFNATEGWHYWTYKYTPSVPLDSSNPIISAPQLTITGGVDATNSDLISWLQSNAELLSGGNTQAVQYTFDFSVTSVTVSQDEEETGIFAGIFGWVKKIFNAVIDLPNAIGKKLTEFGKWLIDQIKGLFIPSEESIVQLKDKFQSLLSDRFGASYQAVEIVENFADRMSISTFDESVNTITFPSVDVGIGKDASGNKILYTFGGWEVDVIPKGFETLVDPLKIIIDIVCTLAFVMALKKRLEGVLR